MKEKQVYGVDLNVVFYTGSDPDDVVDELVELLHEDRRVESVGWKRIGAE